MAQAHKLYLAGEMRRQSGRRYDLVWRQRPDYVSTGWDLAAAATTLVGPSATAQYILPPICIGAAHTDIEALLTEDAANHYDDMLTNVERMYVAGNSTHFYGAEVLVDEHMRSASRFRYEMQPHISLYRCSTYCFGSSQPCRHYGAHPGDCSSSKPLQTCHHLMPGQCLST